MAYFRNREVVLRSDLRTVTRDLAALNRELAQQMILLAIQTDDTGPLMRAVDALRLAQEFYEVENAPLENAEVQQALGDTLFKLGRSNNDKQAIAHAMQAYQGAITLASMLGEEPLRQTLRKSLSRARKLHEGMNIAERNHVIPLRGAA